MRRLFWLTAFAATIAVPAEADQSGDEIKSLRACIAMQGQAHKDWVKTAVGRRFLVSLPPSCRHEDPKRRYVHGGDLWKCGNVSVEVIWGMWGASSFEEASSTCAANIGGMQVMVVHRAAKGPSIGVWYPIGESHEPLVFAWSDRPEDLTIVEGITFSGRVTGQGRNPQ